MSLTDKQIERYARQIIVPSMGGAAQERLLASRVILFGSAAEIAPVLRYLTGAGVGEIHLMLPPGDRPHANELIARSRELNPDVTVAAATEAVADLDLLIAAGGDMTSTALLDGLWNEFPRNADTPVVAINLYEPATIAIISASPPCLRCCDLPTASGRRQENAGFVAMVATTEVLKLLARSAPPSPSLLLQFSGYACSATPLRQRPLKAECSCSVPMSGGKG